MKRILAISAMMLLTLGIASGAKKPKAPKPVACKSISEFMAVPDSSMAELKGVTVAAVSSRGFVVWDGKNALLVKRQEFLEPGSKVNVTGLKIRKDGKAILQGTAVKAAGKGSLAGLEFSETMAEASDYALPVQISGTLESRTVITPKITYEEYFIYIPDTMEKKPQTRIKLWYPSWESLGGSLTNHVTAKGFIVGTTEGDIPKNLLLMSSFEETEASRQTLTSMPFLAPGSKFVISGTVTDVSKRVMTLSDFTGSIQLPVPEDVSVSRGMRVNVRAKLGDGTLIDPKYRTARGLSFTGKPVISMRKESGEQFEGVMKPVQGGYFFGKAVLESGDVIRINGLGFKGGRLLLSASQPLHKCSIKVSADDAGTYDIWYFPESENAIVVRSGKRSKAGEFTPVQSEPEPVLVKAAFKGGDANTFSQWVNGKLKYPADMRNSGLTGKVTVRIVIGTDGALKESYILSSTHDSFSREALRVVRSAPAEWTPATADGVPVNMTFDFPIFFDLN